MENVLSLMTPSKQLVMYPTAHNDAINLCKIIAKEDFAILPAEQRNHPRQPGSTRAHPSHRPLPMRQPSPTMREPYMA